MSVRKIFDSERWKRRRPRRLKAFAPIAPNPAAALTVNKSRPPVEHVLTDYGVAYRARLKQIGDDALKEEFRLRALEAVTNLFRANNPGASVDEANAAVRAAINNGAAG